jgi:hypothetical protein
MRRSSSERQFLTGPNVALCSTLLTSSSAPSKCEHIRHIRPNPSTLHDNQHNDTPPRLRLDCPNNNNNDCRAQAQGQQQSRNGRNGDRTQTGLPDILHTSTTVAAGAALSRSSSGIFLPPVGGNRGMVDTPLSSLPNANTLSASLPLRLRMCFPSGVPNELINSILS